MTICVAAICDKCNAVIVASDKMITAEFLALEFEHPNSKIEKLADCCVGLTAGDALAHTELFRACKQNIQLLKSPSVELIANEVKEQFLAHRRSRAEEAILKPRGFTINEFYKEGLITRIPSDLAMAIDRGVQDSKYPLSILLAGVDDLGAHIYSIEDPGIVNCFDRLGYNAIGSGDRHALYYIIGNDHQENSGLKETLFLVYAAKKKAELAPGVGNAIEMAIIRKSGIKFITQKEKNQLELLQKQLVFPREKQFQELFDKFDFEEEEVK